MLWRREGAVAVISLNRPQALNSIDASIRTGLATAIDRAAADAEVRVVMVRGNGDRAFCAGADIKEFTAPESLAASRAVKHAPGWPDAIDRLRKPIIAAIHGYCLGGGLELALCCDIRVAAQDAVFALPEVRLGIIPGAGGTQRLSRVVGVGHALRMILTGERFDVTHAYRIGLVSDVVPRAELDSSCLRLAAMIATNGPIALAYAKEATRRGIELPLPEGLRLEADLSTLLQSTEDRLEGSAAFRERRTPKYVGR